VGVTGRSVETAIAIWRRRRYPYVEIAALFRMTSLPDLLGTSNCSRTQPRQVKKSGRWVLTGGSGRERIIFAVDAVPAPSMEMLLTSRRLPSRHRLEVATA
jgi:hypothetical protein